MNISLVIDGEHTQEIHKPSGKWRGEPNVAQYPHWRIFYGAGMMVASADDRHGWSLRVMHQLGDTLIQIQVPDNDSKIPSRTIFNQGATYQLFYQASPNTTGLIFQFTTNGELSSVPYDLEILLPVCTEGKYLTRLHAFKHYGLLNIKGYKIRLILLIGTSTRAGIGEGWPCDVVVVPSSQDLPGPKIYEYYYKISWERINTARWFMRLDDDSITDVGGLLDWLDGSYNHNECNYIMADPFHSLEEPYQNALVDMGLNYLMPVRDGGKGRMIHEWEASITSHAAMKRIFSDQRCRKFLDLCSKFDRGAGDHGLAVAARIVKISPSNSCFMTAQPCVEEFSMFGGSYYHIHYVAPDVNLEEGSWLKFTNLCDSREIGNPQL